MVDHSVYNGGGDDRIAQVIAQLLEIYIGGHEGGIYAIAAVNHLKEKGGVSSGFLFQSIKTDFINK